MQFVLFLLGTKVIFFATKLPLKVAWNLFVWVQPLLWWPGTLFVWIGRIVIIPILFHWNSSCTIPIFSCFLSSIFFSIYFCPNFLFFLFFLPAEFSYFLKKGFAIEIFPFQLDLHNDNVILHCLNPRRVSLHYQV